MSRSSDTAKRERRVSKTLAVSLLLLGAIVLGATVLREPIAYAAQTVDAKIIGPLDENGNVKVHEQGTASVEVNSSKEKPVVVDELDTPPTEPFQWDTWRSADDIITVPLGRMLVIEYASAFCRERDFDHIDLNVFNIGGGSGALAAVYTIPAFRGRDSESDDGVAGETVRIYVRARQYVQPQTFPVDDPSLRHVTVAGHQEGALAQIQPPRRAG
jgi:hypothetical protein